MCWELSLHKEIRGLKAWVKRISNTELPALGNVLQELNRLTDDNSSNVDQLAEVILKDSALTAQVLRVANSVQYNPAAHSITTISKAVVLIGFTEVKAISLSVMVIDSLLGKVTRHRLLELIARSFHAAVQAKNIAFNLEPDAREEAFIAGLLMHLGEMAFLGCGGEQVEEYDRRIHEEPNEINSICRDVIGVGFNTITKELAKEWDLGKLLIQCLDPQDRPNRKNAAVLIGEAISRSVHLGWESREMRKLVIEVSRYTGLDQARSEELILSGADEAASIASLYGASKVCHLIPSSEEIQSIESPTEESPAEIQLRVLRKLSDMTLQKTDINRVFSTVLNGLHKGVGLTRVAIALFDTHKTHLDARYVAGSGTKEWLSSFRMPVVELDLAKDVFSVAINTMKPIWLGKNEDTEKLRYRSLRNILPQGDCFVAPISINRRTVGVLYGDVDSKQLDEKVFNDFCLFANQANMVLSLIVNKNQS